MPGMDQENSTAEFCCEITFVSSLYLLGVEYPKFGVFNPFSSKILNRYSTPLSKLRRISIKVKRSLSFDLAHLEVSNRMAKHQTTPIVSAIKFFV